MCERFHLQRNRVAARHAYAASFAGSRDAASDEGRPRDPGHRDQREENPSPQPKDVVRAEHVSLLHERAFDHGEYRVVAHGERVQLIERAADHRVERGDALREVRLMQRLAPAPIVYERGFS
jgi:hypothetical protein